MKFKRFEAAVLMLYIVSSLAAAFIAAGIYLLCVDLLNLSNITALFVASLIWLYLLMVFGIRHTRASLRPVSSMYDALEHMAEGQTNVTPPDPSELGMSKDIVAQILQDVYQLSSGQHDAQAQLTGAKEFAESVIALQNNAILVVDRNRQISYANRKATELMPESIDNPVGMTMEDVYQLEFSSGTPFHEWFASSQAEKIQNRYLWERVRIGKSDDNVRYFDMVADYNKNESHGIETIVMLIDKTDSYHGDDEQMGFVSLAVHELRSPISLLRGYIEVFEDELSNALDADQKMFMQKMSVSAGQLSTFVNNILNVARIESDQLKVHLSQDTIYDALNSSMEDFSLRAEVRNRKLTYQLEEGIGPVALDRVAFYEVISNLIDNAIKYSKDGGEIIVSAKKNDQNGVTVSIQDFGVGIPASSMENLFERFYRSHHSRDQVSGTGLGLFLSKRIVEAHGGHITVESKEGEGSTFAFELPSYETIVQKQGQENPNADQNGEIVRSAHGWIKNHGKVRK